MSPVAFIRALAITQTIGCLVLIIMSSHRFSDLPIVNLICWIWFISALAVSIYADAIYKRIAGDD